MSKDDQFTSYEFIEDHNILTNVEDYSRRVKAEADAYAESVKRDMDELKAKTADNLSVSENSAEAARTEAQRILEKAKEERERIFEQARIEGKEKGYEEGKIEAIEEGRENIRNLASLLAELASLRVKLYRKYEKEMVEVCLVAIRMVIFNELKTSPDLVLAGIRKILKRFEGLGNVKVFAHPEEYAYLRHYKDELAEYLDTGQMLTIKSDPNLPAGSSVTVSDFTEVNLELARQLEMLDTALRNCYQARQRLFEDREPKTDPETTTELTAQKIVRVKKEIPSSDD